MPPRATRLPSPDTSSVADAVPDLVASVLGVPAISVSRAVRLDSAENRVFRVCVDGRPLIIRMTPESRRSESEVRAELAWLRFLGQHGIAVVRPVSKDPAAVRLRDGERVNLVMFDYIHGLPPQPDAVDIDLLLRWGKLLSGMRTASDAVPPEIAAARRYWRVMPNYDLGYLVDFSSQQRAQAAAILRRTDRWLAPAVLVHGDLGLANILVVNGGPVGVDFDDACRAPAEYDIAATLYDLLVDWAPRVRLDPVEAASALIRGYRLYACLPSARLDLVEALWAALAVERAITARRLGLVDNRADEHLLELLDAGRLPAPIRGLRERLS